MRIGQYTAGWEELLLVGCFLWFVVALAAGHARPAIDWFEVSCFIPLCISFWVMIRKPYRRVLDDRQR